MSQQQRDDLDTMLREGPLDLGGDVAQQRAIFAEMMQAIPIADDVTTTSSRLGGVPVTYVDVAGASGSGIIFYLHGGAYAIGSAELSVGLASDLARRSGMRAVAVDYRLSPENPYPAGLDDAVTAYTALLADRPAGEIAIAGESAGAGLAVATLLTLKDAGLALPAAAFVMSPWVDLTLSGDSIVGKASVDPALTADGLHRRAADYTAPGTDPTDGLVSPIFAYLHGLPPLLVQAGSHEILLDDAVRLAARAAAADVSVRLEITAGVPHVFQAFAALLDDGDVALTAGAAFLRSHLEEAGSTA
jgi:monoterpene epsilon-lactone hydrolase